MQLDDVMARMTALEGLIGDLQQELARAKVGGFRSMRDTRRCPACRGGRLLHIPAAMEFAHGAAAVPLTIHHQERGFFGSIARGPIEHFVCRACLLIESHVTNLKGVEPDGKTVIALDPEPDVPSGGPFR